MDRGKKINDFQFKKFRICQQRSAMKVGTDGILLTGICNGAEKKQLHLIRLTEVKPTAAHSHNRCLMEFSKEYLPLQRSILEIYMEEGKDYTENFRKLTADFYLNF